MSMAYRAEIDGLRALAVVPVVLYHFRIPGFSGGFVGVDVFFVISGFLIGSILWREQIETGNISFTTFYIRRFKRLMPAFTVMAVATMITAYFVFLPFELAVAGRSLVASVVYLSNNYFYEATGYFDTTSQNNPFLHTWSLSVEEQFYVLLPVILIFVRQHAKTALIVLTVFFVLSFAGNVVFTRIDHMAAFYLFPFRAWELFGGVALGIWRLSMEKSPHYHPAVSWGGLALLIFSITSINAGGSFPGVLAMFPALGASLIILGGQGDNLVNKVLSQRIFVVTGLISYSLYLWHWPVSVFSHYYRMAYSNSFEVAGWIVLCVALAWMSHRYVERPFRRRSNIPSKRQLPVILGAVTTSCFLAAVGLGIHFSNGMPQRFEEKVLKYSRATADYTQDFSGCYEAEGEAKGLKICPFGDPDVSPSVFVWGDSHARALREGIHLAASERGVSGLMVWSGGCPPVFDVLAKESIAPLASSRACALRNYRVGKLLSVEPELQRVLLIGRWAYYTEGTGIGTGKTFTIHLARESRDTSSVPQAQLFSELLAETVLALTEQGKDVAILASVPEFEGYSSRLAARITANGSMKTRETLQGKLVVPLETVRERQRSAEIAIRDAAKAGPAHVIDPVPALCNEKTCSVLMDGVPIYFDDNHLTNTGAKAIRRLFDSILISSG